MDVITSGENSGAIKAANAASRPVRQLSDLPGPKGMPLLGNLLQIKSRQFHQILENWEREFGPFYQVRLGRKPMLVVSDNATITNLLRARPDMLRRGSRVANALNELGTRGLFTAEDDEWRKQRKLVMRALTPEVIRNFFPALIAMTENLRCRWQRAVAGGKPIDLMRDLKAFTLDVTVALAMGQQINALENEDNPLQRDIEQLFERVARRVTAPFPYWRYLRLPVDRAADACADRVRKAMIDFILRTRQRLNAHPERRENPSNMLEALLVARDESGTEFTDDNVIGNAITMVFAGEDTTANTIAWLLERAAHHSHAASCMQSEADALLGEHRVLRDFDTLDRLVYIDAANTEAMRMRPVASILSMEANLDLSVGEILVPKGTTIMALLRKAGQQGGEFADSDYFRPERWLSDKQTTAMGGSGNKLFPFGGGPRFCPGRYLAMTEIKMVMSMIARNFMLKLDADAPPVQEFYKLTMTPNALPIRLAARQD